MTNKVNIQFLNKQLEKAFIDIEKLKDKVRAMVVAMIEIVVALLMIVNGEIKEQEYN